MAKKTKTNPEGWPDTDPYPYRDSEIWPPKEIVDCDYVKRMLNLISETPDDYTPDNYSDIKTALRPAWDEINRLTYELRQKSDHVKWLRDVGGDNLSMACGVDILCRKMAKEKKAAPSPATK